MKPHYWPGCVPQGCLLCRKVLLEEFVDGATAWGSWVIMCPDCHADKGVGLGPGRGQQYAKEGNRWLKTGG
jgi:hypothetical protein